MCGFYIRQGFFVFEVYDVPPKTEVSFTSRAAFPKIKYTLLGQITEVYLIVESLQKKCNKRRLSFYAFCCIFHWVERLTMIWNKEVEKFGKDEMLNVGVRIQEKRSEQCIKAIDFAEFLGISKDQLSRIENGRTVCRTEHLYVIAQYLEVSVDYLLFGNEYEQQKKELLEATANMKTKELEKVIRIIKIMKE